MKTKFFILILFTFPTLLLAGREEGVMNEFRAVEDALRAREVSEEAKIITLEKNLIRAVKLAVTRRFYLQRKDILKDISPAALAYESPTSELIYYVRFKNYIIRFDFAKNPELFDQAPYYEKFLIKDENAPPSSGAKETPEKPEGN
ncbi:MAG: hypothetical protein OEZ34_03160 [Spirochaetia bacterium]|nr:hypothetical protein [Spirochaetia bacterium]